MRDGREIHIKEIKVLEYDEHETCRDNAQYEVRFFPRAGRVLDFLAGPIVYGDSDEEDQNILRNKRHVKEA